MCNREDRELEDKEDKSGLCSKAVTEGELPFKILNNSNQSKTWKFKISQLSFEQTRFLTVEKDFLLESHSSRF